MVTFICENCDQTLKKRQIDRHIYQCRGQPRLVCIDCNKIFDGLNYKAHITCISEQEKTMGQYYKPKKKGQIGNNSNQISLPNDQKILEKNEEKIAQNTNNNNKWIGWKKTIRKTLQKQSNYEMKLPKLKALLLNEFLKANEGKNNEAEQIFLQKIKNIRFKLNGDTIKYMPKSIREEME